jgi:hypothetical protein
MNLFDPAHLTPVPKTPVACPLPYALTWDDLRSILPGIETRGDAGLQAFSSYEKQGLNGGSNSCILTLQYPAGDNQAFSKTVFIKQTSDPEKMEAQKYRALASFGIPTPRVLKAIHKNNVEILLLEILPKIGIDFHAPDEVTSLLHLAAQVNAIQNPPVVFTSPAQGIPQTEFDELVRAALLEVAQDRSLPVAVDVARWFSAYQVAQTACKSLPTAVNHNQFYFQQVGWAQRDGVEQLVIFDLETMFLSPRFSDIAGILPALALYTGRQERELFKIYFDRVSELTHQEPGMDEAFHEMKLLQIRDTFYSLPWLVDMAKKPDLNQMLDQPLGLALIRLHDSLASVRWSVDPD